MKFTAQCVRGKGRGKFLGFPTFNLEIPEGLQAEYGIYAGRVWIHGQAYLGAIHFGPIPTFQETTPTLEIFVLDYDSEEEVAELSFELGAYLREIRAFATPEELSEQIAQDVKNVRDAAKSANR